MGKTDYDASRYFNLLVFVFGILGNLLVIISVLRQKNMLKNNYYFLVLHLAFCDLGSLIYSLLVHINSALLEKQFIDHTKVYNCLDSIVNYLVSAAGIGMMLTISVLRYRATVHPFKPAISRRKLKLVCGLLYVVGFIVSYGTGLPLCFLSSIDVKIVYKKFLKGFIIMWLFLFPTIFMAVVYFKIGRALVKQNKYIKSICSNSIVTRGAPRSSSRIATYLRNRKIFLVCILTVLCYGLAYILSTVHYILVVTEEISLLQKYYWITYWGSFVHNLGKHSANPLIYGVFDRKLLNFWKLCHKKPKRIGKSQQEDSNITETSNRQQ